jgi:methionyl-tRNA formyltransferase
MLIECHNGQSIKLCGVLTSPDAPGKRGKNLISPPVKHLVQELIPNLPILQPQKLDSSVREQITLLQPDLLVCVAYGKIFGPKFLALFPYGGINLHPSLLPRYRGPAPVQAAVIAGEQESGITVQQLGLEMDGGDILHQERRTISLEATAEQLLAQWAEDGASMVEKVIRDYSSNQLNPIPQDPNQASYCTMLNKDMGIIDWTNSALMIHNQIRGLVPWPGARTWLKGQALYLWESYPYGQSDIAQGTPGELLLVDKKRGILVQTGSGLLQLKQLQLEHKNRLPWKDFINGNQGLEGLCLGENR